MCAEDVMSVDQTTKGIRLHIKLALRSSIINYSFTDFNYWLR